MSEVSYFDTVNWYPSEWRHYEKGDVISFDDLGACTFTAQKPGWYFVVPRRLGDAELYYRDIP
jgi:hypothetical protein